MTIPIKAHFSGGVHNDSGQEYAAMKLLRGMSLALMALAFVFVQTGRSFAEYPDKPIRLLLPFPAGGAVDIVARVMAATMAEDLGKPILIENKSGAGGIVATDAVAKSSPDGYTLLLTTPHVKPAKRGPFARFQEISGSARMRGGPGRTRTSNQTVMSGTPSPEKPIKSDD